MDGYTLNNNGYYNILMSAYNTDGQIRWAKSFGGGSQDFSSDICVSSDNYIYLCGSYTSNTISFDTTKLTDPLHFNVAYIAKFSDDGRGIWAQNIYGAQNTSAYCITSDNSNNVFLAGFFDSTAVFGAGTLITTLYGYPSFFVAKYTSDGLVSWSREITSTVPGNLDLRDITSDKCGSLWVTGPMSDTTQVDNNIITAPDGSFDPMYIAKFDADGGANTVFTIPSGGYFWRSGIATDQQDDMYLTATFAGPSFELAGDTIYSLNGKGGNYLAKYGQSDINSSQPFHDTTICDQRIDFYIKVDFPPGGNVIWNNGSVIPLMHVRDTGTYWVRISNSINCNTTDTFHVSNAECGCGPVMPTGFTPNGDGKNDEFKPIISPECNITSYFMAVYNRWGQQIFFSQNLKHGWDGTFNGSNVEVGTYMYMIEYRNEKSNINRLKKGDITLIR
jgi:gliding motility-associated-like protein